jgi:hypothetical protein
VAGDSCDAFSRGELAEGASRDETGGDDERLRYGGVADRVGIRSRAVGHQVDAGAFGELLDERARLRVVEPGGEEAGGLRALSGSYENDHRTILPMNALCTVERIDEESIEPL